MIINKDQISLKDIFESKEGVEDCRVLVRDLIEGSNELGNGGKPLMRPEQFSILEIMEAVGPSTFPLITSELVSKKVMDAYEMRAKVLDKLVTPFDSNMEVDKVPGAYIASDMKSLTPGQPYPHSGDIKEKYVTIEGEKRGEILDITEEMVKFDQTGLVMMRAAQYGEHAAQDREKRGMHTIQDQTVDGVNFYAWYPAGARTAMYSTSTTAPHYQSNQITNALTAWDDIDDANVLLGLMKTEEGEPIVSMSKQILVPMALETIAKRLIMNTQLPGGSNEEMNPFTNAAEVVASPYLDLQSSIIWFWGDFKKQYLEKVVFPLQVMVKNMSDSDDGFERDIYASYKIRHFTQVAAQYFQHVVKSTGAV